MSANGQQATVILNGTTIDGTGEPPTRGDAIVIESNRIRSVGPIPGDLNLEDREKVRVIDASGQWVMPGLIDGHCHLSFGQPSMPGVSIAKGATSPEFNTLCAAKNAQKVLRSGVTSLSIPGGTWFTDVALREAINSGLLEGPRIFLCRPVYCHLRKHRRRRTFVGWQPGTRPRKTGEQCLGHDHRSAQAVQTWCRLHQVSRQRLGR